jgi:hypothetical protein
LALGKRNVLVILTSVAFIAFVRLVDPFGLSTATKEISREVFDAVFIAPWYDQLGVESVGERDVQDAATVVLITDRSLRRSELSWPLPATQLNFMLRSLAAYDPAAVVLDVVLTQERPDPRIPPDERPATTRSGSSASNRVWAGRRCGGKRASQSRFAALSELYRPLPRGERNAGEASTEKIPLLVGVPNPKHSPHTACRLAPAPDRFLLPSDLLIPGLRCIATPTLVQWRSAQEPETIPLKVPYDPGACSQRFARGEMLVPAAAALAAFCNRVLRSDMGTASAYPGCRHLGLSQSSKRRAVSLGDVRQRMDGPSFVHWGLKASTSYRYFAAEAEADAAAETSRAERCPSSGSSGPADPLRRIAWMAEIITPELLDRSAGTEMETPHARCTYTPTIFADLKHWPMRTLTDVPAADGQGTVDLPRDLIEDRVVFIGTDLEVYRDRVDAPVHGTLPGVYLHAMAFDNLLRFGDALAQPAPSVLTVFGGGAGLNAIDLVEILLLGVAVTFGQSQARRSSEDARPWLPPLTLLLPPVFLIGVCALMDWPTADWLLVTGAILVWDRGRAILSVSAFARNISRHPTGWAVVALIASAGVFAVADAAQRPMQAGLVTVCVAGLLAYLCWALVAAGRAGVRWLAGRRLNPAESDDVPWIGR